MLDDLRSAYLGIRLAVAKITTTATPTAVANIGPGSFSTVTRSAAGKPSLTMEEPFRRAPVVVCQNGSTLAAGGFAQFDTDSTKSVCISKFSDAAGSGADGYGYVLIAGSDTEREDFLGRFHTEVVATSGREMVLFPAKVTAAGVCSPGGVQLTCTLANTSEYTLTLRNKIIAREMLAFATPIGTTARGTRIEAASQTAATVKTWSVGAAATANDFYALLVGFRTKDEQSSLKDQALCVRRRTRLIPFHVVGATGACDVGPGFVTSVRNSTGDYTLTWNANHKFAGEPIVILSGKNGRAQNKAAASSTGATVVTFNAAGAAADVDFNGMVVGFGTTDEN